MYTYKIDSIKSIYDGDTFIARVDLGFGVIKEEKFRMAYINAPEMRLESYEAGKISRNWLRERITTAIDMDTPIIIKTNKDTKGKYGRYIADVFIDGISINLEMIELGLAEKY